MQTVRIVMGKTPTIIVTGKPTRVHAKPLRSGKIRVGLAKVVGWKMSPEGQQPRSFLPTLGQTLQNLKAFCDGEFKRLGVKPTNRRPARCR
jgi:hypothetical protein